MLELKNKTHLLEVVGHLEFILLTGNISLHLRICIVDDSQEHVQQYEEHEEYIEDEVHWTQNSVCSLEFMEVEVSQDDTEQSESVYVNIITVRQLLKNVCCNLWDAFTIILVTIKL